MRKGAENRERKRETKERGKREEEEEKEKKNFVSNKSFTTKREIADFGLGNQLGDYLGKFSLTLCKI